MLPGNASQERKRILKAYGAEMIFSDPGEGSDGAIRMVPRRSTWRIRTTISIPDQYNNPANWKAHFDTTGPEIIEQTGGGDALRRGMGTSGTFMGVTRRLQAATSRKCSAVRLSRRSGFHGLEGLKHMPTAIVPGIYDERSPTANLDRDRGRL